MKIFHQFIVFVVIILLSCLLIAATNKTTAESVKIDFQKTSKLIHEADSRPDFPVSILLTRNYAYSVKALGETIDTANKSKIIEFIKTTQRSDGSFSADKIIMETALLYTDYALETLAYFDAVGSVDVAKARSYVLSLSRSDGGFAFNNQTKDSSLSTTYYAVHCLSLMNALSAVDKAKITGYIKGFEKKNGGFGYVKETGFPTAKNTYEAVFVLKTLGMLDGATKKGAVKFLTSSSYVTGKKGKEGAPTLEEEAYTLGALKILGAHSALNKEKVISFVKQFYVPFNGGFASMPGYGAAPDPTYYGLRCLTDAGVLQNPR